MELEEDPSVEFGVLKGWGGVGIINANWFLRLIRWDRGVSWHKRWYLISGNLVLMVRSAIDGFKPNNSDLSELEFLIKGIRRV